MTGCRRLSGFVASTLAVALLLADRSIAQPSGGPPLSPPMPSSGPVLPQPQTTGPLGEPVMNSPDVGRGVIQATPIVPPTVGQPVAPPSAVPPGSFPVPSPPTLRFNTFVRPGTPTKELLPPAPKTSPIMGPILTDDLTKVPEVEFQANPMKVTSDEKLMAQAAQQLAKISHLNAKKTDAFMSALLENRSDLAGLPFIMGDDCRSNGDRVKHFTAAVNTVRQALGSSQLGQLGSFTDVNVITRPAGALPQAVTTPSFNPPVATTGIQQAVTAPQVITLPSFWSRYTALCEQEDSARTRPDKKADEHITLARIAALTQMLAAESAEIRLGLVKYLTAVPHVEATKALAQMAIFSAEDDVRAAAITALKVRREKDYTDILVRGLRYPWPMVAKRSAEAITKLERNDLIPELLAVLDSTDPRIPITKEVDGKSVAIVREVVKVNHHRSCMMCHAPANSGSPNPNAITAEVAVQGQPLPTPAQGYQQSAPELMIRVDVTYLRPDFSASMPVKDAHPWPEMQRFDFLVRERKLTEDEATSFRTKLTPKEEGVLSPYHKAALTALRDLSGKDTAPTAKAWRKLLNKNGE